MCELVDAFHMSSLSIAQVTAPQTRNSKSSWNLNLINTNGMALSPHDGYSAPYQRILDELHRAQYSERESIIHVAHHLILTSRSSFIKFATLSLLATVVLLLPVAGNKDDGYLDLILPSLVEMARQIGNFGAACSLRKFILRRQHEKSKEEKPGDSLRRNIFEYYNDCQSLTRAAAASGKCQLPSEFSSGQNAFPVLSTFGIGWQTLLDGVADGISSTADGFGRPLLHVILDEMPSSDSPLWAFSQSNDQRLQGLYKRSGVNTQDALGRTALHIACSKGLDSAARSLAQAGASFDLSDSIGRIPLHWALLERCGKALESFCETENRQCLLHRADSTSSTPLSLVLTLCELGDDFSMEASSRLHNLWCTHRRGSCKEHEGWGLLHLSAIQNRSTAATWLLDAHFRPFDCYSKSGRTPLSLAAERGHVEVLQVFLQTTEVDPDSQDNSGRTPLSWAAENGHEEVIRVLLGRSRQPTLHPVDPDRKDEFGRTPLYYAVSRRRLNAVILLLATNNVDPLSETNEGETPFSKAEALEDLLVVDALHGALRAKPSRTHALYSASERKSPGGFFTGFVRGNDENWNATEATGDDALQKCKMKGISDFRRFERTK
ncbi:1-alkyl-2-acetylglycerophosphocholine esterase [Scedosporium apiospermum]|uniref:protein S-acyltransferase n=1 Tax=Pseudallescheria apiosperma TaxID=563466 RepID=A0A084GCF9_PSEDA|nr:1-alkyl-2-acetylglycerophosphocholine esterase [Scedosporium apiospermum]KEZ45021.1 1-alkyl-2-acetylglycerophosphocholine esterase [Scedosporium apiospermum]